MRWAQTWVRTLTVWCLPTCSCPLWSTVVQKPKRRSGVAVQVAFVDSPPHTLPGLSPSRPVFRVICFLFISDSCCDLPLPPPPSLPPSVCLYKKCPWMLRPPFRYRGTRGQLLPRRRQREGRPSFGQCRAVPHRQKRVAFHGSGCPRGVPHAGTITTGTAGNGGDKTGARGGRGKGEHRQRERRGVEQTSHAAAAVTPEE